MLKRVKIEKLFDLFDYTIELKEEGVTILTGPNGYGKTTVLKILDALASKNGFFFVRLLFKEIILEFSGRELIALEKKGANEVLIKKDGKSYGKPIVFNKSKVSEFLRHNSFIREVGEDRWLDRRTDSFYDTDTLLQNVLPDLPEFSDGFLSIKIPKMPNVYFIREQRLLRPVQAVKRRRLPGASYMDEEIHDIFCKTIEEYTKELRNTIKEILAKASQITQELDSSFPRRLFDQKAEISEKDFNQRFNKVREIQNSLSKYGLSDIKEDNHPTYKPENAKALCVYIDDIEKKLAVFSGFLDKLKTFTDILNERRFTFKRIDISKDDGFKFSTEHGKPLALGDLSSGEQQEVVLLYELLFKVQPGTLVLIDEPEISLHVAWQKQFLDDLFKIVELQKVNVIIATHSPQIINEHWDLTVDLEEISRCGSI
jgi:predicted ATP-binding protein involved in virulence